MKRFCSLCLTKHPPSVSLSSQMPLGCPGSNREALFLLKLTSLHSKYPHSNVQHMNIQPLLSVSLSTSIIFTIPITQSGHCFLFGQFHNLCPGSLQLWQILLFFPSILKCNCKCNNSKLKLHWSHHTTQLNEWIHQQEVCILISIIKKHLHIHLFNLDFTKKKYKNSPVLPPVTELNKEHNKLGQPWNHHSTSL